MNHYNKWIERIVESEPSAVSGAVKRAGQPVVIYKQNELFYDKPWAVATEDDYWMDCFDTRAEAESFVAEMGWPLIEETK